MMRAPVAPHAQEHLVSSAFPTLSILTEVWWYLIVVLICISLMTYDVGTPSHMLIRHLFIFFGVVSVQFFAQFLIGLFSYFRILRILCILWMPVLYHTHVLQIQVTLEQHRFELHRPTYT